MKVFILILILFSAVSTFSQTVSYTYDKSGNRTVRTVNAVAKSSQAPQVIEKQQTVTALSNPVTEKDISIYPNPTQGHFTVDISNIFHEDLKGEAYLFDTNGRLIEKKGIHSHHLHKKLNFNLNHKVAGVYILNIRLEENTFTWKIIKK